MNFISFQFAAFFTGTCITYFVMPKKQRWMVLLVASYGFYLSAGLSCIAYLLITSISTFVIAIMIEQVSQAAKKALQQNKSTWSTEDKQRHKRRNTSKKRYLLATALLLNFGILAFIKYWAPAMKIEGILLPLGISFYMFQSISYLIDIYRGIYQAEKNIFRYALFVSFFPQMVQGPIGRYNRLSNNLLSDMTLTIYGCCMVCSESYGVA